MNISLLLISFVIMHSSYLQIIQYNVNNRILLLNILIKIFFHLTWRFMKKYICIYITFQLKSRLVTVLQFTFNLQYRCNILLRYTATNTFVHVTFLELSLRYVTNLNVPTSIYYFFYLYHFQNTAMSFCLRKDKNKHNIMFQTRTCIQIYYYNT